ncbi:MAG: sugar transferase [bacterium]
MTENEKKIALLFLDYCVWNLSLAIIVFLRNGSAGLNQYFDLFFLPFSFAFAFWFAAFLIFDLYQYSVFQNITVLARAIFKSSALGAFFSILYFYFLNHSSITPKTILIADLILFPVLLFIMRLVILKLFLHEAARKSVLLLGGGESLRAINQHLVKNPASGFRVACWALSEASVEELVRLVANHKIETIVLGSGVTSLKACGLMGKGISVVDAVSFREDLNFEIPIEEAQESWFLSTLGHNQKDGYDVFKRIFDIILADVLFIIFSPILILIALLIEITNDGSAIYTQTRVGLGGKIFTIYKFRTMKPNSESGTPVFASKDDTRITILGRFLRHTHLDELPQLWNILRGDMSFIGPRPERPEFVSEFSRVIKYYDLRQLVRPGITGWAQINFSYGSSVAHAARKLCYDLYYVKNRSIFLDLKIILKTTLFFVLGEGRSV